MKNPFVQRVVTTALGIPRVETMHRAGETAETVHNVVSAAAAHPTPALAAASGLLALGATTFGLLKTRQSTAPTKEAQTPGIQTPSPTMGGGLVSGAASLSPQMLGQLDAVRLGKPSSMGMAMSGTRSPSAPPPGATAVFRGGPAGPIR